MKERRDRYQEIWLQSRVKILPCSRSTSDGDSGGGRKEDEEEMGKDTA